MALRHRGWPSCRLSAALPHNAAAMRVAADPQPLDGPAATPGVAGWLLAWMLFWALMMTIAVQDHLRNDSGALWRPFLWEGSSCLVASAVLAVMWRRAPRHDDVLARPLRWFALQLRWVPLLGPLYGAALFALCPALVAL